MLQETANRELPGALRAAHPFTGDCNCAGGAEYRKALVARRDAQLKSVVSLTGWSPDRVRQRMSAGPDNWLPAVTLPAEKTWWQKMWQH